MKLLPTANEARRVFLLALLAAVALLWLAREAAPETAPEALNLAPAAGIAPAAALPAPAAPAVLPDADIFAVRTWQPPPPPAPVVDVKPAPPPRPQAPPLPFRFLGKIDEPDKALAFLLARGDRVLSVSVGQSIDGTYLVEKHDGARLYFIYKPLKSRQSISTGRPS